MKSVFRVFKSMNPSYRRVRALREEIRRNFVRIQDAQGEMDGRIESLRNQIRRLTPQAVLNIVEMDIVSHCNLNCTHCSHFAPAAKEEFMDLASAQHDFIKLAKLSGGKVNYIHIMGGEPLLHPDCCTFLIVARSLFPDSVIRLVTNGLLLSEQMEAFWRCLADNRIVLSPTKYPVPVDWECVEACCAEYGIALRYFNKPRTRKTMTRFALDPYGTREPQTSFLNCACANVTPLLHKGRLYPCAISASARHLDGAFTVGEEDSIDIHKASDMQEILAFLAKPIPFCSYCDVENRVTGIPWEGKYIDLGLLPGRR